VDIKDLNEDTTLRMTALSLFSNVSQISYACVGVKGCVAGGLVSGVNIWKRKY